MLLLSIFVILLAIQNGPFCWTGNFQAFTTLYLYNSKGIHIY